MASLLLSLGLFVVACASSADRAWACASCGSGGDDPMILYPNETNKLYLGMSQTAGFRNVDGDGELVAAGGPARKQSVLFSYGRSFNTRSFATLTVPFMRNELADGTARTAMGDPSLAGRYTAVMQSLAEPWLPQVQIMAGYKHAQATSIHDTRAMKTLIDVFGNGFSEAKAGVDVWYGQTAVKVGAAYTLLLPRERHFDGVAYQPGRGSRATLSLGYMPVSSWKATLGMNREARAPLRVDGVEDAKLSLLNHTGFVTLDWMPTATDGVRLSCTQQAFAFKNRNTARSNAVSLAYMTAI